MIRLDVMYHEMEQRLKRQREQHIESCLLQAICRFSWKQEETSIDVDPRQSGDSYGSQGTSCAVVPQLCVLASSFNSRNDSTLGGRTFAGDGWWTGARADMRWWEMPRTESSNPSFAFRPVLHRRRRTTCKLPRRATPMQFVDHCRGALLGCCPCGTHCALLHVSYDRRWTVRFTRNAKSADVGTTTGGHSKNKHHRPL